MVAKEEACKQSRSVVEEGRQGKWVGHISALPGDWPRH